MRKDIVNSILLSVLFSFFVEGAFSQTVRSSYFLEGMPGRHKLNPAFSGSYNYIGFPGLSGIVVGGNGNVGVSNFLFPGEGGQLMNFLDPSVNATQFLDNIRSTNKVTADINVTLLSAGFYAFNGYNTIDVSIRANSDIRAPKEIFEFLKVGRLGTGTTTMYDMSDIKVNASSYVDIAFGHSRRINDKWEVGGKIKALLGLGRVNMDIDRINLTMTQTNWIIESHGTANVAFPGAEFHKTSAVDVRGYDREVIDGFDVNKYNFKIVGGGIGFDVGAVFRPIKNLSVSAALTDVGFICWTGNKAAQTINDRFIYNGYDDEEGGTLITDGDISKDLSALLQFEEVNKYRTTTALQASLNLGVEYSFLQNMISLGALSHTRFGPLVYTEGMLVANIRAPKIFMMSVNGTISNLGGSFGALINICPKGFNFFVGIDCFPGLRFTPKYYIPTSKFNVNYSMGINITFGEKNPRKESTAKYADI
ncbi:MAG: DUF5723 family protein [Bacteroidales bacterium]